MSAANAEKEMMAVLSTVKRTMTNAFMGGAALKMLGTESSSVSEKFEKLNELLKEKTKIENDSNKSAAGLSKSFNSVIKGLNELEAQADAAKAVLGSLDKKNIDNDQIKIAATLSKSVEDIIKGVRNIDKEAESAKAVLSSFGKTEFNIKWFKQNTSDIFSALGKSGEMLLEDVNSKESAIKALNKLTDDISRIKNKELNEFRTEVENNKKALEELNEEIIKTDTAYKHHVNRNLMLFAGTLAMVISRQSTALTSMHQLGFATDATAAGMAELATKSLMLGVSQEEAIKFNRQYANQLVTLSQGPLLSASDGLDAMSGAATKVRKNLGLIGESALQFSGELLAFTMELGEKPVKEMDNLVDGITRLQHITNKAPDELMKSFSELSSDSNFQSLFLTMDKSVSSTFMLTESFEKLHKATGMTMDTFINYRKQMAKESQDPATDRFVRAAFTSQMAAMTGITGADRDILIKGRMSPGALQSEEEIARYDAVYKEMQKGMTEQKMEAQRGMNIPAESLIETLMGGGGVESAPELIAAEMSGLKDSLSSNFDARMAQAANVSKGEVSAIMSVNTELKHLLDGFNKSVIAAPGYALIPIIAKGIMAGALGTKMGQKAVGSFYKDMGTKMGRLKFFAKGAGALGLALGTVNGVMAAMTTEGDALTKAIAGTNEFVKGLTFGLIDLSEKGGWAEGMINGVSEALFGVPDPENFSSSYQQEQTRLGNKMKEGVEKLEEARENKDTEQVKILKEQLTLLNKQYDLNKETKHIQEQEYEENKNSGRMGRRNAALMRD